MNATTCLMIKTVIKLYFQVSKCLHTIHFNYKMNNFISAREVFINIINLKTFQGCNGKTKVVRESSLNIKFT